MALKDILKEAFSHDTVTLVSKSGKRLETFTTQSPEHLMPTTVNKITRSMNGNQRMVSVRVKGDYQLTVGLYMTIEAYKFLKSIADEPFSVELSDSTGKNDPVFLVDCYFPDGIPAASNSMESESLSTLKIHGTER